MATQEELLKIFIEKRDYYERQCSLPQKSPIEFVSIYADLKRMCEVLQGPCNSRHLQRAEMYLKELEQEPHKEPVNYKRFIGYY